MDIIDSVPRKPLKFAGITMKFPRRQFLHLSAGAGALLSALRVVRADTYPSRSVRFIVGFPAGNASDVLARLMGRGLSDRLAQKLVIENRPGARSEALPDVPTLAEFVPGYDATGWYGIGAPKGTPAEVIDRLNKETGTTL